MSDVAPVAVCIPAFNEVAGVTETVESIWATGYPRDRLQVIVAVDGGDPAVSAAAEAAGAEVVVVQPNRGSYAARNAAADHARSDATVLLFTDADCRVSAEWITAHLDALEAAPMSGGAVRFVFSGPKPRPAEWVDAIRHLRQEFYVKSEHYAATCNLAVRREVFTTLRFDESLRTGGDADFGFRAAAAGYDIVYSEAAVIEHRARATRRDLFTKVRRVSSGAPRMRALRGDTSDTTPRSSLAPYRKARAAGLRVGPLWGLEACVLDYWARRIVNQTIRGASSE